MTYSTSDTIVAVLAYFSIACWSFSLSLMIFTFIHVFVAKIEDILRSLSTLIIFFASIPLVIVASPYYLFKYITREKPLGPGSKLDKLIHQFLFNTKDSSGALQYSTNPEDADKLLEALKDEDIKIYHDDLFNEWVVSIGYLTKYMHRDREFAICVAVLKWYGFEPKLGWAK